MAKNATEYAALMSYTRFDAQYLDGYLTELRIGISREVQAYTGQPFRIFQDIDDIKWGEQFEARIDQALDTITFFIPILTPSFFQSEFCRYELEKFLAREQELGRSNLVLPVYYIEVAALEDKHLRDNDPLAQTLAARQRIDWRELRFEPFEAPEVRRALGQIAQQIATVMYSVADMGPVESQPQSVSVSFPRKSNLATLSSREESRPMAFMSYATDDDHDNNLTRLHTELGKAVRDYYADDDFIIIQDRIYVRWGDDWERMLLESLDEAVLFIPILTPRFFKSEWCQCELDLFNQRQEKLQQQSQDSLHGIICPIYYIDYKPINDSNHPDRDSLVESVLKHQYIDWRRLRREPFSAKKVKLQLDAMAHRIRDALDEIRRR